MLLELVAVFVAGSSSDPESDSVVDGDGSDTVPEAAAVTLGDGGGVTVTVADGDARGDGVTETGAARTMQHRASRAAQAAAARRPAMFSLRGALGSHTTPRHDKKTHAERETTNKEGKVALGRW